MANINFGANTITPAPNDEILLIPGGTNGEVGRASIASVLSVPVGGKGLSSNDFTDAQRVQLEALPVDVEDFDERVDARIAISKAPVLTKTQPSVVFRPNFQDLTGWLVGEGWANRYAPALTAWGKIGMDALTAGAQGSSDYGGIREGHPYKEVIGGVEKWYLFYGAGNGTDTTDGEWRVQLAVSTDKGVSYTRLGPVSVGLQAGSGTAPKSRDMLYMERRANTYILHAMKGMGNSGVTTRGRVPAQPYYSDIWTLPALPEGLEASLAAEPWTFADEGLLPGADGTFDEFSPYAGSVVGGLEPVVFYSSQPSFTEYNIGLATMDTFTGGVNRPGVEILSVRPGVVIENPKVFFHAGLGLFVMLLNKGTLSAGKTVANSVFLSNDLKTWSYANERDFAGLSPMDGGVAIGIPSPFYKRNGIPDITAGGFVPITYDGFPVDSNHVGRKLVYSALEPSTYALTYTPPQGAQVFADSFAGNGGLAGQNGWTQVLGNTNATRTDGEVNLGPAPGDNIWFNSGASIQNGTVSALLSLDGDAAGVGAGIVYRAVDANNFYLLDVSKGSDGNYLVAPYIKVDGTYTLMTSPIAVDGAIASKLPVTIQMNGGSYTALVGDTQINLPDDANFLAAGPIGLRNGSGGTGNRIVEAFTVKSLGAAESGSSSIHQLGHANFVAQYEIEFSGIVQNLAYVSFDYRRQTNGDCYRLKAYPNGLLQLFKVVGVTETAISTLLQGGTQNFNRRAPNRVRVAVTGSQHIVELNGEQQLSITDASLASGQSVAFSAYGASYVVRNVTLYPSPEVSVTGLEAGNVVTLRSHGGIPIERRTADAETEVFTVPHFPIEGVEVDGEYVAFEDMIYGGAQITKQ